MQHVNQQHLTESLLHDLKKITSRAQQLHQNIHQFNQQPRLNKWSVAQVIEHLNTYNRFYLPEIGKALANFSRHLSNHSVNFNPGFIGNYLTQMMRPNNSGQVTNKMKAFKKHIPSSALNAEVVLQEFLEAQTQFAHLVQQSASYDLNKIKIGMSTSRLIRLKLGDLLSVLIVHQQRHFIQIDEVLKVLNHDAKHLAKTV